MSPFVPHSWVPIEDLPADWKNSLVNPQTGALVRAWQEQAEELRKLDAYTEFLLSPASEKPYEATGRAYNEP